MKKSYRYRVTLEELDTPRRLQFDFDNHDDVFAIVERLNARDDLVDAGEIPQLVVGTKLLGKVVMENRKHPLFSAFYLHFVELIKALKKGTPPLDEEHPGRCAVQARDQAEIQPGS
ncbi:MAG: DUF3861 domain-containing protein [Azoarcus sp.]|nr:DUF3861 domain-containing protein [Azoarcus sp.]